MDHYQQQPKETLFISLVQLYRQAKLRYPTHHLTARFVRNKLNNINEWPPIISFVIECNQDKKINESGDSKKLVMTFPACQMLELDHELRQYEMGRHGGPDVQELLELLRPPRKLVPFSLRSMDEIKQ